MRQDVLTADTISAIFLVCVAIPLILPMILRAVLSTRSILFASPLSDKKAVISVDHITIFCEMLHGNTKMGKEFRCFVKTCDDPILFQPVLQHRRLHQE